MRYTLNIVLALALSSCAVTPVVAWTFPPSKQPCFGTLDEALTMLEKDFGEQVLISTLDNDQHLNIFTVNTETGDWSYLIHMPSGNTCIINAGEDEVYFHPLGDDT